MISKFLPIKASEDVTLCTNTGFWIAAEINLDPYSLYPVQNYAHVTCQLLGFLCLFELYFEWMAVKYAPCIVYFIGKDLTCETLL